ncbi:MAG: hypothetical protein ACUVX8_11870 [Candidatus Zipacnadales bacterium]
MIDNAAQLGAPGIYHFTHLENEFPVRLHLRVDPDRRGLLLANAAEAAHLSPVGVLMVHAVLEGYDDPQIIEKVRANFHGSTVKQVTADLSQVRRLITELLTPDDNFPITNFGTAAQTPDERRLSAPFQAYIPQGPSQQVEPILQKLWEVGVPHVTLLRVPERPATEIVRAVECAEDIGMIAGVRTVAHWLNGKDLRAAAMAGLDFLTLVLAAVDAQEHEALLGPGDHGAFIQSIAICHEMELCPVAQVPLTEGNVDRLDEIIEFACSQDIRNFTFFAVACLDGEETHHAVGALPARTLPQVAVLITECAEEAGARFLWAPPVRFDREKTLADHIAAGPRAGGDVAIRVEIDGTVYPPRGELEPCGNLLQDAWSTIWEHDAFTRYRETVEAPRRCAECPDLVICDAGCVKDPRGWSDDTSPGGMS